MKTKTLSVILGLIFLLAIPFGASAQKKTELSTREMNFLSWQKIQKVVPESIQTVLLPVGSIEPHGVIPNGTDNLAPETIARHIAEKVEALIAPTLNYGVTPSMEAFPGAVSISSKAYSPFVKDVLRGLAQNKFKNIIILNGHGGNTELLHQAASRVSRSCGVRILVVNWWSLTAEDVQEVFGEKGGHAGNNETAYIQAVYPQYVNPENFEKDMATPNPKGTSWFAVPVPSSILLYKKGEGYPTFDMEQAKEYFRRVNQRVVRLIQDVIKKWDKAGLYR
ncbi:creatininase family protein [bacterium]|nr:creatininase family protein [bacterium]